MYKVLKVTDEKVSLGEIETKSLRIVDRRNCYEGINVGEIVDLFESDNEIVVSKSNNDVNLKGKNSFDNKLTSIISKSTLTLSVKNLVIVSILAAGFAIVIAQFVENNSIASNDDFFQAIVEYVKDEVESDDIVAKKKDFTFHYSTPYMIENGYPYKSFAVGKVIVKNSQYYDSATTELFINCTFEFDDEVFCYSSSSEE